MNDTRAAGRRDGYEAGLQEHEALRSELQSLQSSLNARAASATELAAQMAAVATSVEQHFSAEEADGLFEQIERQAPRLTPDAELLREDHRELLSCIGELCEQAAQADISWKELAAEFSKFSGRLLKHEATENQLLLEAYDQDIGSQD